MEKMSEFWSMNEGTFYCLYDQRRTLAFKKAIIETVQPGHVVVEMGAGSGILSMFAADAGAKKVYAVELDKANVEALEETIKLNGYSDRIIVIEGDATAIDLPEKADVIICEMIATGLVEELQIPAMNNALRFAKSSTKVILKEYHIEIDLVEQRNTFFGKEFGIIRYEFPDKTSLRSKPISNKALISTIDFTRKQRSNFLNKKVFFTVERNGDINGIRIGGTTILSNGDQLGSSLSYSFPAILPITKTRVRRGDRFEVKISYSMCEGPHRLRYSIKRLTK